MWILFTVVQKWCWAQKWSPASDGQEQADKWKKWSIDSDLFCSPLLPSFLESTSKKKYSSTIGAQNDLERKDPDPNGSIEKERALLTSSAVLNLWSLPQSAVALPSVELCTDSKKERSVIYISISWDLCPHFVPEGECCQLCLFVVSIPCFRSVCISWRGIVTDEVVGRQYSASSSALKNLKTQWSLHTIPFKIKL
jgi:hypothetical protein